MVLKGVATPREGSVLRLYLVTLTYRLPPASRRGTSATLPTALGEAYVGDRWTDESVEIKLWQWAPGPSDAVGLANRRFLGLWPVVGPDDDPRAPGDDATGTPVLQSAAWEAADEDADGLAGVREPRPPSPSPGHLAASLDVPRAALPRD